MPPTPSDNPLVGRLCNRCSYPLDGLRVDGTCPECGQSVAQSQRGWMLAFASTEYLRRVSSGLWLYLAGIVVVVVGALIAEALAMILRAGQMSETLRMLLSLIPLAMMGVGFWRFTTLDPGFAGIEARASFRRVARVALVIGAALALGDAWTQLTGTSINQVTRGLGSWGQAGMNFTIVLLALAAPLAMFFASLRHAGWLFARVPDPENVKRTEAYMWQLPLIFLVGCVLLFAGPIIATVLYRLHMRRLYAHVSAILESPAFAPAVRDAFGEGPAT